MSLHPNWLRLARQVADADPADGAGLGPTAVRELLTEVEHRRAEARHYDDLASKALGEVDQLRRWLRDVASGRATKETHAAIRDYLREVGW